MLAIGTRTMLRISETADPAATTATAPWGYQNPVDSMICATTMTVATLRAAHMLSHSATGGRRHQTSTAAPGPRNTKPAITTTCSVGPSSSPDTATTATIALLRAASTRRSRNATPGPRAGTGARCGVMDWRPSATMTGAPS